MGTNTALRSLRSPDSGFTTTLDLKPITEGYAVAIGGSDKLMFAKGAFQPGGAPSKAMVSVVRDRIDAALKMQPPAGTKIALGAWHNPADGKIEVNVTVVFPPTQRRKAEAFGKAQDQIAMFSLHEGDTIMLGGSGGDRSTS